MPVNRGCHLPPTIVPATPVILPDDTSLDEMLNGLEETILVESVIGLDQGKVLSSRFSNNGSPRHARWFLTTGLGCGMMGGTGEEVFWRASVRRSMSQQEAELALSH